MKSKSKEYIEGYKAADIYANALLANPYHPSTKEWFEFDKGFAKREFELNPTSFATYNRIANHDNTTL